MKGRNMLYFSLLGYLLVHNVLSLTETVQELSSDFSNAIGDFRTSEVKITYPHEYKGPFRQMFQNGNLNINAKETVNPGEPLFLTPLLEAGKIKEARNLSRVRMAHRYGHSFSGFFTVNKKFNSNMFFWFFSARTGAPTAPVVVWLQGGPGGSSLFGLFAEHGPFSINKKLHIVPRNYSWNNNHNVLYIDNPVGTGFSFTDNDEGYARNEADVGKDLYAAMSQFFQLFPALQKNELYITGESYAGKYVPALAYTIHKNNPKALTKMNLKGHMTEGTYSFTWDLNHGSLHNLGAEDGIPSNYYPDPMSLNFADLWEADRGMAIGDGLCDPVTMTDYGDFLYQIGLVDTIGRKHFKEQGQLAVKYIQQKEWKKAFLVFDRLLNGDTIGTKSYFYNVTGLKDYYNFLRQDEPKDLNYWGQFINQGKIRKEIHVGNLTFNDGQKVEACLEEDMMKSVKPWIEEILKAEIYKVMIYNGQLDIIIASTLTDNFVSTLDFQYADRLKNATRYIWKVDSEVAGYVKEVPNFVQVLIRDAGHLVPYDQPKWAFSMITSFTHGRDFN